MGQKARWRTRHRHRCWGATFPLLIFLGRWSGAIACICWGAIAFLPPEWLQKILDKKKGSSAEDRRQKEEKGTNLARKWRKKLKTFFARCVAREKMRPLHTSPIKGRGFPSAFCLLPSAFFDLSYLPMQLVVNWIELGSIVNGNTA
ncbi:MAG: hypothetical protein V7K67_17880 [Nostoc sp.]|uniref:hypothetical protein n=1 Tax=Nostoc sp. TaxID=1180 RepID=UPI002FF60A39